MKVYTKTEESYGKITNYATTVSILTLMLFVVILELPTIFSEFTGITSYMFSDYDTFIRVVIEYGFSFILAITFCGIFLFIYLAVISVYIKPPKEFKAKLISKELDTYNGRKISYMKFAINSGKGMTGAPLIYCCFTYAENEFIEGNYYSIKIKECNRKIKEVGILEKEIENKIAKKSFFPVFFVILFIFGSGLIIASLRMDYCIKNNLNAWDSIPEIILFSTFVIIDIWMYWNIKHADKYE